MTFNKLPILLVVLALLAAACGGAEEATTADTTAPAAEVEEVEDVEEATTTTEAPVEEEPEVEEPAEEEAVEATPIDGQAIYESNCARCHGADGIGTRGPDLIDINTNVPDQQVSIDQVINGGGTMPSFGARLSEDEIQATVDYVYATF